MEKNLSIHSWMNGKEVVAHIHLFFLIWLNIPLCVCVAYKHTQWDVIQPYIYIKKEGNSAISDKWMCHEGIKLSKTSQTEKDKVYIFIYM